MTPATSRVGGVSDERRRRRRGGLETNLRTASVWSQVSALATSRQSDIGRPLRVLDLGGGTGGLAVALAAQGHSLTVVDPSPDALASLRRRAAEELVSSQVSAVQGDADTLSDMLSPGSVDLICCHGTLEVTDDPAATLQRLGQVLAPGGLLSLVTAQRVAAVLARALAGRFDQARDILTSPDGRWGEGDPMPRRFDRDQVVALLGRSGFTTVAVHGVRLFSDLVPSALIESDADQAALIELEDLAAADTRHPGLAELGTSMHVVARRD